MEIAIMSAPACATRQWVPDPAWTPGKAKVTFIVCGSP